MNDALLEIGGADTAANHLLPSGVGEQLEALYGQVPAVSCTCDRPGQCCELTEAERAGDFATMYPLYLVEFLNIADHVRRELPAAERDAALAVTDERPDRCTFLTDDGRCSIHPVRPLACRTYGVLSREVVESTAKQARGEIPSQWISSFLFTERHTCCPHAESLEPHRVADHADNMIRFAYERKLVRMGRDAAPLEAERLEMMRSVTGRDWISRWSWGGSTPWCEPRRPGWSRTCRTTGARRYWLIDHNGMGLMYVTTLDRVKPGDEVAEQVENKRGMVILPKGTKLTPQLIDRLKRMGVTEVPLTGHDPSGPPPKTREELLSELDERFDGFEKNPLMMEIKRIAREHMIDAEEN